jgi:hypothetical protein
MKIIHKLICFLFGHRRGVISEEGYAVVYCIRCQRVWYNERTCKEGFK